MSPTTPPHRIYELPGDSLSGFTDALRRDGDIEWTHVRHEGGRGIRGKRSRRKSLIRNPVATSALLGWVRTLSREISDEY
jgi:hypothetical protein